MVKFLKVSIESKAGKIAIQRARIWEMVIRCRCTLNTLLFSLQPGKVVILLTGRYAGKKAVIVKNNDDGIQGRSFGHAVVVGLAREPRKVCLALKEFMAMTYSKQTGAFAQHRCKFCVVQIIKKSSQKKQERKSRVKVGFTTYNCHLQRISANRFDPQQICLD